MLKNELARAAKMASMLYNKIEAYNKTGQEIDFPQWWQSKIIKAKDYLQSAYDYLDGEEMVSQIDAMQMEEKDPLDVVVAEKKGKDLDGDGDIDSDDYLKARSLAIQKAKAKKVNEARSVATDFQFTPKQFELLKNNGVKVNTTKEELYIPDLVKIELDKNRKDSNLKKELFLTAPSSDDYIIAALITGIKNSLKNKVKINDQVYWTLKGHFTKKGNFNFPNPTRAKLAPKPEETDTPTQDNDINKTEQ